MSSPFIRRLDAHDARAAVPALAELLADAVRSGASVGYVLPFESEDARPYWLGVAAALHTPYRVLLIAEVNGHIMGTVQLHLEDRPNGSHRAEISKLLVHTDFRRRGYVRLVDAHFANHLNAISATIPVQDIICFCHSVFDRIVCERRWIALQIMNPLDMNAPLELRKS